MEEETERCSWQICELHLRAVRLCWSCFPCCSSRKGRKWESRRKAGEKERLGSLKSSQIPCPFSPSQRLGSFLIGKLNTSVRSAHNVKEDTTNLSPRGESPVLCLVGERSESQWGELFDPSPSSIYLGAAALSFLFLRAQRELLGCVFSRFLELL